MWVWEAHIEKSNLLTSLDVPGRKLGSMVCKMGYFTYLYLPISGVYWGYNPLTNLLLSSWDIQVVLILCGLFHRSIVCIWPRFENQIIAYIHHVCLLTCYMSLTSWQSYFYNLIHPFSIWLVKGVYYTLYPFPFLFDPLISHTLFEVNVVLVRQIDVEPKRATSGRMYRRWWLKCFESRGSGAYVEGIYTWYHYFRVSVARYIVRWLKGVCF